MSLLNFNLSSFGLDITDRNLKLVQAVPTQKRYRLQAWGAVNLKPGVINEGEIVNKDAVFAAANTLRETVQGKLTSDLAVVSLPESKSFIKLLSIDKPDDNAKEDSLISNIEAELPKQIPLPVESIVYDHQVVSEGRSSWQVLVGAVPRDLVHEYTEIVKAMGFKPLALEIEAQSIMRAVLPAEYRNTAKKKIHKNFNFNFGKKEEKEHEKKELSKAKLAESEKSEKLKKEKSAKKTSTNNDPLLIADLGASRSSMIIYHQGVMKFTRTIELSGNQLTAEIADTLKLTPSKAEQAKVICGLDKRKCKGQVSPIMDNWVRELEKELLATIEYYASVEGIKPEQLQKILLCGGSSSLVGLSETLSESLQRSVKRADPLWQFIEPAKHIAPIPSKSILGYATAIGLSIR